jgi:hypothetical protein
MPKIAKSVIQLGVFALIVIPIDIEAWYWFHDPLVNLYFSLFAILLTTRFIDWPKAAWFGTVKVDRLRRRWGAYPVAPIEDATRIADLRNRFEFHQYFGALLYSQNTQTLCNEIYNSMSIKIVGYLGAALLYAILDRGSHEGHDEYTAVLKSGAFVAATLLPLIWDYARCEGQRYWNKEIREPS